MLHEHHRDRLREKVFFAPTSLNDYELLEVILFNAIPRKNTNDIAHRLIDKFGTLSAVFKADAAALLSVEGVGKNTAAYLAVLGEVMRRNETDELGRSIFDMTYTQELFKKFFSATDKETMIVFFLDKKQHIDSRKYFSDNDEQHVDIDLSELAQQVAILKPASVAFVHNHPSGSATPSADDDDATEKFFMLLSMHGVALFDHIIVAKNGVFSYQHTGRLKAIVKRVESKFG